ncbi:MAG: deoxyribodipyrimidine photo-lyase [Anaerolineae bacterium]|nr:deoxyribodipyrimidine photo-lyase [Anaerolineae bacterium]
MAEDMRRDFESRDEMIDYLREQFPESYTIDSHVSEMRGGRLAAEEQLQRAQTGRVYAKTRNELDGAVTCLSPYLRYGVLSLAEVRDYALKLEGRAAEKFINELGWRDYWQRLYQEMGDGIWEDREPYKTGIAPTDYAAELPDDIVDGTTGIDLIDDIVAELRETGYLHNRLRMYFAAYVVHWRRVRWQAGARFFLTHLLDGDPASNNLSWQWVASTFSHQPDIFNLENVRKFSADRYTAPSHEMGMQLFEGTYDEINHQLFDGKSRR